jgi:hypothetical protein
MAKKSTATKPNNRGSEPLSTPIVENHSQKTKPYALHRLGLNDETISVITTADTIEDLWKKHTRRADWRYAVYYNRKRLTRAEWAEHRNKPEGTAG